VNPLATPAAGSPTEGWGSTLAVFRGEYRRAATLLLLLMVGITALAWAVTIGSEMSGSMMTMMVTGGGWAGFALFLGIWSAMMVAMMFPACVPMAEAHVHLSASEGTSRVWRTGAALAFLSVYVAVWTAVGTTWPWPTSSSCPRSRRSP
jgi:predicted metal-binding membrane protein